MKRDFMAKAKAQRFSLAKKAALALFAALAFFACDDAGLGESIDTAAPTVSITSPKSSQVLSGLITISGTCYDDKKVGSVSVTVTNTSTNKTVGTYTAVAVGNSWSVKVNAPKDGVYPMPDGIYSANAVCYDIFGRKSGLASRVFEVDITAPVFCVTSPNSLDKDDPAAYGRSVKIKGEIADDHAIKQMDIRVFKIDGSNVSEITSSLAKTTFSGFETAGGTEIKIAQYYPDNKIPEKDSEDYPLYQNYMAMYAGSESGKTVKLYIFPFLTDIAGNTNSNCYIQTQIKKLVSDVCKVQTTSDSLQTAQFKKMLNGSYSLGELNVETVKKILNGTYVQKDTTYTYLAKMSKTDKGVSASNALLAMSVNSNNSPMYEFGGFAVDRTSQKPKLTEVSIGGQISVKVSAGLDGTLIQPKSLKVELQQCNDKLIPVSSGGKFTYIFKDGGFVLDDGSEPSEAPSVATATYPINLPGGIVGGSYYLLTAEGVDEDGNDLYSDNTYAFVVTMSASAPSVDCDDLRFVRVSNLGSETLTIEIEDKQKKAMKNSGSYVTVTPEIYHGYYAAKTMLPNTPTTKCLSVTHKNTDTPATQITGSDGKYQTVFNLSEFKISDTLTLSEYLSGQTNCTIAFVTEAYNGEASCEETSFIIWADNAAPVINVSSPAKEKDASSINIKLSKPSSGNPSYTAQGTWSDEKGSGTSTLEYSTDKGASWTPVPNVSQTASKTNWSAEIEIAAEGEKQELWFKATDAVGNESAVTKITGLTYDFADPTLDLAAPGGTSDVKTYYNYGDATPDSSGNWFTFTITANDSFKIASLEIKATKGGTEVKSGAKNGDKVIYTVTDTSPASQSAQIVKTVKILADNANGKGDGVWTITATAKDAVGRSVTKNLVSTTIDCVKPSVASASGTSGWFKDKSLSVNLKLAEATSGLESVYYKVATPEDQKETGYIHPTDLTGLDTYVSDKGSVGNEIALTIKPSGFEQNDGDTKNILYVQAVDKAGNKGDVMQYEINGDQKAPDVSAAYYTYGSVMTQVAGNVMTNGENSLAFYGDVSDPLSGLSALKLKIGAETIAATITYSTAACSSADDYKGATYNALSKLDATAVKTWKAVIAKENLKSGKLNAVATDKAGNSTEQDIFTLVVDKEAPFMALSSPKASSKINGSVTFKGTAKDQRKDQNDVLVDTNDLASMAFYYAPTTAAKASAATWTKIGDDVTDLASMVNWSVVIPNVTEQDGTTYNMLGYGEYKGSVKPLCLKVVATDKAGNSASAIYEYSIDPDGDRPQITITNVDLNKDGEPASASNPAWKTGSKAIHGSVYDDDGVTAMQYKDGAEGEWMDITLDGSSFTIKDSAGNDLDEGEHTLYFKITDAGGATFESSGSASYVSPKLYGKNEAGDTSGAFETGATLLYVNIDVSNPELGEESYLLYSKKAGKYKDAPIASLETVGGDSFKFKYRIKAKDTNGIAKVSYTITYKKAGEDKTYTKNVTAPVSTTPDASGYYDFEVADIDVSGLSTGTWNAEIVVEDRAGSKSVRTTQVLVDITAPEIKFESPDAGKKVLGVSASVNGTANGFGYVNEDGKDLAKVYYAVCPASQSEPADDKFVQFKDASVSWKVAFDGVYNTDGTLKEGTHSKPLNEYLEEYGIPLTDLVEMNVWIMAEDEVGNVTKVSRMYNVDPNGDRPDINIGDPEKSGISVGGLLRLNGDVIDPNPNHEKPEDTDSVWIQIISDKETGHGSTNYNKDTPEVDPTTFNLKAVDVKKWVEYKNAEGQPLYSVYNMKTYQVGQTNTRITTANYSEVTNANANDYGILANFNGANWSLDINSNSEFQINSATDTNQVAIRAYVYNGKWGVPATRVVKFDANAPRMSDRFLVMNGSETKRAYTDNIYIRDINQAGNKATWNLTFTLSDDDFIGKIGFSRISLDAAIAAAADVSELSAYCTTNDNYKNVAVSYPLRDDLGIGDVGKETIYVYYEDKKQNGNPGYGSRAFTINHDNKSPVLTTSGEGFNISQNVYNNNGWYELGSKAQEGSEESGFARTVFYFKRVDKIYDPMYPKRYKNAADAYVDNYSLTTGVTLMEGLYWKNIKVKASLENGATVLTLKDNDPNIHTGGLVKILGTNYRISGKKEAETTVNLASDIGKTASGYTIDAYFALGNVVDNTIQEDDAKNAETSKTKGYGYGYYASHPNDDLDLMIEGASKTNWWARINSKNIPDGPIDICYTVYDAAGNYSTGSVTGAFVANNAPKIANVTVGTDWNGNDTIEEGKDYNETLTWFATDDAKTSWSDALDKITLHGGDKKAAAGSADYTSAYITAKGMTVIRPEIVGGNGALYYHYSYQTSANETTNLKEGYNKTVFMASDAGTESSREDQDTAKSADITMQVGDLMKAYKGTGKYEFIIYDSTEGLVGVPDLTTTVTTPTTQKATITLYIDNQVNDTTKPTGKIQRFYWKDINDNSIYGSKNASDAKDLLGHIELEGELPASFNETAGATDKEMDTDPKVSGKIVIRGEAFDAVRLDSLYITLPGFDGLTGLTSSTYKGTGDATFYKVATFDPAHKKWIDSGDEPDDASEDTAMTDNGWRFNVESSKFDADGHHVTWKLELDTNKHGSTVHAATDVLIEFMSKDKGVPTCSSGTKYTSVDGTPTYAATQFKAGMTSDYTAADGSYQMDIVPYITKVYTNLAKANASNWSVFSRTANGVYPVYTYLNSASSSGGKMTAGDSEVVQVYGFNLNGLRHASTPLTSVASANRQDKNADYDCYEFAAGALTGTGSQAVDFNVNGIITLNNKNANDAKGDYADAPAATPPTLEEEYSVYANYYNRLPNDSNNNRLNDDVKFDVWQLNNSAAVPISNKIVDPVMKINPKSGKLGFAFENDPTYFSMPNGKAETDDERSYDYWAGCYDKVTVPSFDYIYGGTDQGEVVALAQGNDISSLNADNFMFYYSKWNNSHDVAATGTQTNGIGLEQIGYTWKVNGTDTKFWDKSRFQGTSVVSANKHVYLAYYDRVTSQIRFRSSLKNNVPNSKRDFGNLVSSNNYAVEHRLKPLTIPVENAQVFASLASTTYGTSATTYKPSQHLCLAAKAGADSSSDDLVAIVWYDGTDCYYSYNTTPGTTDRAKSYNKFDGTTGWSAPTKVFSISNVGQYCKVAFDYNGGVHVAAYDAENTCVYYAYSASATSPSFKSCMVDAKNAGGSYLTLDVALEGGVPVPQIGYYSSACAKPVHAKYVGPNLKASTTEADDMAGAIGNYMTGVWEISAVPSTSVISKDRVNVALRKDSSGVITKPAGIDDTHQSYYSNGAPGYGTESYGVVYGLANTNAVLGYCRAVGAKTYIETAQRK